MLTISYFTIFSMLFLIGANILSFGGNSFHESLQHLTWAQAHPCTHIHTSLAWSLVVSRAQSVAQSPVPNECLERMRLGPTRGSTRVEAHTGTQEPFVQAVVDMESEENISQVFESACTLGEKCCGLDLEAQVIKVHKDYAKGIEASRRKIFPNSRPCDDYAHMRRASYPSLQMHIRVKNRPELSAKFSEHGIRITE